MLLLTVARAAPVLPNINTNNVFNVTAYGAVGDGSTDNTTNIQNAINAAGSASGGGTVEIPGPGVYLSGPLTLKSKINLQIDNGATLKFLPYSSYPDASGNPAYPITANTKTDLEISGSGTIDGNGAGWWSANPPNRPYMIYFSTCYRVLIQDVTLQNPPKMHIVFKSRDGDITIQGITINTPGYSPNTDGIDLVGTNCLVQNCTINAGDDNIALGSSSSGAVTSDILITNCAFGTGHGVSIGSNTAGGVSNLTVINCTFNGTDYGIRMKSDDNTSGGSGQGGLARNLSYYNLGMTNIVHGAIVIYSYYSEYGTPSSITPYIASTQQVDSTTVPVWSNIIISNVTATVASSGFAGIIWGRIEVPVSNILLSHVNITAPKTFGIYNAQGVQIADSQVSTPAGIQNFAIFNAQVTLTNSTPDNNPVTFDGLTSANSLALYNAAATMTATDVFGANPITLSGSSLIISNTLTLPPSTVLNFTEGTIGSAITATGSLTCNNALNITAGSGFGTGNYTLFNYNGGLSGTPTLGTTPAGFNCALNTGTTGQVKLAVTAPAPPSPPHIDSVSLSNGDDLIMSGISGYTNGSYYVLASTNLALQLNQWPRIATNQFDAAGHFAFTNVISLITPQMFYLLQLP